MVRTLYEERGMETEREVLTDLYRQTSAANA